MKHFTIYAMTILTCCVGAATSSTRCEAATTKSTAAKSATTKSVAKTTQRATFLVEGMTCVNCSNGLTQALRRLKGVSQASVDLASKRAVIVFDARLQNVDKLRAFIVQTGFKATLETAKSKSEKAASL